MTLAQILKILIVLEPVLLSLDASVIQPEIQKLIAAVSNPELKAFLTAIDVELDTFVKAALPKP